jgi:hypothetical protein
MRSVTPRFVDSQKMKLRISTNPPWEKQPEDTGRGAGRQYRHGWGKRLGSPRGKRVARNLYLWAK